MEKSNGAENAGINCKTLYMRKKFAKDEKCLCDVYFEYPVFETVKKTVDKKIRKNLEKINEFYKKFAENAYFFAEKTSFPESERENTPSFLRIFFTAKAYDDKISVTLILSERKNSRITEKNTFSQIWDIKRKRFSKFGIDKDDNGY